MNAQAAAEKAVPLRRPLPWRFEADMPDSMITVASIVRRLRVDLERPDSFWPAQLAALVSIVLS
jgi:hypothetical protein